MKRYLVIISALSLLLHACGGSEEIQTVAIRPVKYAKIQERGASQTHTFSGTSQSSKETKLSFRVSGIINTLNVKVGQEVRQGQMIARLDPSDYNVMYEQSLAQLKSAETQIKQARAQRVSSKSNFDRIEKLYENNSLPLSDFDQAKTNYEAAESTFESALAQVAASQKQVESAANQLNYTQVNAPFSGIITQVMVEENELVNTGSPIASLSTDGQPEVQIGVPEVFISRIKQGQKVDIHFSSLNKKDFKGVVSEVGFSADGATTYPVTVLIEEPSDEIRPGMATDVRFSFGGTASNSQEEFLIAPVSAVGEDSDGSYVFVLEKKGKTYQVKRQKVELGELLSDGFVIKKGLKEGQIVATAGIKALLDGMEVKLLED